MIIVSEPELEGEHETQAPDSDIWADTEEEPLDGETAEGTGRLWSEAYLKLEKDDTCKSLIASYKVLLNGDIQEGDEKYKDPSKQEQMTDLVGEKLEAMTKKQWTLTWGKTSFVIREQAKKIIKVVQTFSEIGTVVARLDPAHAGIAWAAVCALLPVSHFHPTILLLGMYILTRLADHERLHRTAEGYGWAGRGVKNTCSIFSD